MATLCLLKGTSPVPQNLKSWPRLPTLHKQARTSNRRSRSTSTGRQMPRDRLRLDSGRLSWRQAVGPRPLPLAGLTGPQPRKMTGELWIEQAAIHQMHIAAGHHLGPCRCSLGHGLPTARSRRRASDRTRVSS